MCKSCNGNLVSASQIASSAQPLAWGVCELFDNRKQAVQWQAAQPGHFCASYMPSVKASVCLSQLAWYVKHVLGLLYDRVNYSVKHLLCTLFSAEQLFSCCKDTVRSM